MFPHSYFAPRYFTDWYFPPLGGVPPEVRVVVSKLVQVGGVDGALVQEDGIYGVMTEASPVVTAELEKE